MRTLRSRMVVASLLGALTVALVTALLAFPLVRSVATDQARDELARSVEALAGRPRDAARELVEGADGVGPDDRTFGVVGPRGTPTGPAADVLDEAQLRRLAREGTLSMRTVVDGDEVLVEARSTPRGQAVVGVQPLAAADAADRALVRRVVLALLLGLTASTALAVLVARRVTGPVVASAVAAGRMADGERGVTVPTSSIAEIGRMTEALAALDRALVTSEGRQREFLLSVSHELRTPLTALRGYAEALAEGAIGPEDLQATGRVLVTETHRLDRFVADLLSLARLESDDFAVDLAEVDPAEVLLTARSAWEAVARAAGVELVVEAGSEPALTDPRRLRQVVDGLVENALRVAPAGTQVVLRSRTTGPGEVVVEVEDHGPGLTDDDRLRAFERGHLRDRYAGERPVGTGLGLSIAHRLAERMGARLVAAPAADGALWQVHLPRSR
ncbi:ATPase/histidine kinase/DNA gyrase B/HSP90 domain protein [Aeromicrobium marinum DSM 15272]|uniref:Signal transduction histidine-protein kinase/phosphatase MprB n=1 Tax=Aeromicrobium marinum DSM 15272 TaxID=585531 RepID=E2SEV1_9ACTN|nr:HAMP domain-containing sensor histidine kinase [Aeromicrobium marinum]EFQ82398.1 ATPase/histidine kinase/DNA gyrase B/HSP90 domain protein [Aeromicrobium marinum DSM 15272]